jgi:hypothetical protein
VSSPLPPPDLRARVLAAARSEPARSRASGTRRRALAVALGFAFSAAFAAFVVTPKLGTRPPGYVFSLAAAWIAIAVAASWGAVARGRSMLGRPIAQRVSIALVTPAALIAAALVGNLLWPETVGAHPGLLKHAACAMFTVILALGPLVAFLTVLRRSDPVAPGMGGAALGAAAGAWGALGIELFCTCPAPGHVFVGHVLPVLLLAIAGAFAGGRALRVVAVRTKNG